MPILFRLFTDLTVYREITVGKLSSSLVRYGIAYLCISLTLGFWVSSRYSGEVYTVIDSLANQVETTIPESATFNLTDGILSATATTSSSYFSLDATADATLIASSPAFLALGQTHFRVIADGDGTQGIRSYKDEGWQNGSLTGKIIRDDMFELQKMSHTLKPYLPFLLTFPIFMFYSFARILHTLFYAVLLRIFGSTVNRAYQFTHYWQLTLHTVIVADTINLLVLMVYHQSYPLVFTVAFFGTTLLAYLNLPVNPKPQNHQPASVR